jgi:hypothetical protein
MASEVDCKNKIQTCGWDELETLWQQIDVDKNTPD